MTKIIGLTGGIGSGKTLVANYIKSLGIPIYLSDDEAKKIMENIEVIEQIKNTFGNELVEDRILNRKKLAQLVFNQPDELNKLNNIIHPLVKKHFDNWVKKQFEFPFVIKEAAILFESGSYKDCDKIILVTAPIEKRIQRVLKRDNCSKEAVLDRIKNQWTDEEKAIKSDYVIHNDSVKETKMQTNKILKLLENL